MKRTIKLHAQEPDAEKPLRVFVHANRYYLNAEEGDELSSLIARLAPG